MLQVLEIKNFAIINQVAIDFSEGMTVLTGETGAGKSIIIDAIGQLMGGRGSTDFIRYGEDKYQLRGTFFMPDINEEGRAFLEDNDIPFDDQQLLIQRELNQTGKNVIKVNGVSLTVSLLKLLGQFIVDIHGQNEHQSLMQASRHIHLLDAFAQETAPQVYTDYKVSYEAYRDSKEAREKASLNDQETAQRMDLLAYQINEIDQSQIQIGEESQLNEERQQMRNYEKLVQALNASNQILTDQEVNVLDLLANVINELASISSIDDQYENAYDQANSAYYSLQDLASSLRASQDSLYYDPQRLDDIEARLQLYSQLKRKYGPDDKAILAFRNQAQVELEKLENLDSYQTDLEAKYQEAKEKVLAQGQKLHQVREKVAQQLNQAINHELAALYMEKAEFKVAIQMGDTIHANGLDQVEFLIKSNVGEPFKALAKTASGGELSRLMLAMKTVLQSQQNVTAIIFDEVDTGVSGRVAQAIANKMAEIAFHAQVLCISHLPQVAAMADHHLHIQKREDKERTVTEVKELTSKQRVGEIAQMTAGTQLTQHSLEAASELLDYSEEFKAKRR
ncbi:DNA repair protein RecN [Aerococcus kribbianus]|uniref:DNA repair protein RecN n=1 Tax=Aerococcus kribbianus TaxID=2999064 RepID=A0A9X3FMK6_9LACT|nr:MULTISPECIES: DNA repair protein RecN [unclassified Aerococcus]MCZ0717009.1 DNA repair protein RecN [Aerococcus sp. YH-aer221]MCZ0725297.1 DNA repair protein RecN [Aerococcus sp. YH-aer222]